MLYFAYGANTDTLSMQRRCPGAECLGPAKLLGYKFKFAIHADVKRDTTSVVQGVLWKLTDQCLKNLDIFESYPYYYQRKTAMIRHEKKIKRAMIYYMCAIQPCALPDHNYLNLLLRGYKTHNLNTEQLWQEYHRIELLDNLKH